MPWTDGHMDGQPDNQKTVYLQRIPARRHKNQSPIEHATSRRIEWHYTVGQIHYTHLKCTNMIRKLKISTASFMKFPSPHAERSKLRAVRWLLGARWLLDFQKANWSSGVTPLNPPPIGFYSKRHVKKLSIYNVQKFWDIKSTIYWKITPFPKKQKSFHFQSMMRLNFQVAYIQVYLLSKQYLAMLIKRELRKIAHVWINIFNSILCLSVTRQDQMLRKQYREQTAHLVQKHK